MDNWYGIGYPRSANSWVRYIVRTCSGDPEIGVHSIDGYDQRYVKRHWLEPDLANGKNMLLLVRNYKEVVIRHNSDQSKNKDFNFYESLERMPSNFTQPAVSYIHPIHVYDNWANKKHIVYYEDLVEKPFETIQKMGEVMGFQTEGFLDNYYFHKDRSVNAYSTQEPSGSWTKGGQIKTLYEKQISEKQKEAWDQCLKFEFPVLFEKYLKRYEQNET